MFLKLYIGEDILDMFQDESVEINSSIANVNDITKNTTDYIKSFTVPASSPNNRIFKHYYDANVDNSFDARVKVSGRIELDGIPFRTGKWSLEKVNIKQGNPSSYSINFVGNLISLKDKLGNDELSSLDFSSLDHIYNSTIIKTKLQNDGDLIYTLLSKKQLYYKSFSEDVNTSSLANIAYSGGASTGVKWNEIRAGIKLIKIIEAIEVKYGFTFSRDFFGRSEFTRACMLVNNDSSLTKKVDSTKRVDFTNYGTITSDLGAINLVDDTFIPARVRVYGLMQIVPAIGYETVTYTVERRLNGDPWGTIYNLTGTSETYHRIDNDSNAHSFYVSANDEFKFTSRLTIARSFGGINGVASFPEQTIPANFVVSDNMPKIKIIDFLKGLFSMFKLVVISDDNENIYIDTIVNYYAKGKVYDLTRYIKTDSLEVSRGNLLNQMNFKFKDPITILNSQFKKNTGLGYGDEETKLTDDGTSTGKPLEGEALVVELPFEQIVYERLPDLYDGVFTNIMYGGVFDEKLAPANPSPHIFYNINLAIGSKTIGYIHDNGSRAQLTGNINTASHSIDFASPQYNLSFGIENNEWSNIASENTLFSNYYMDYVTAIFDKKRRSFKFNGILPIRILLKLQLNDVVEIKNNFYRIDNFNLNLLTKEISLNLINAFDNYISGFFSHVSNVFADYQEQTQSISIANLGNSNFTIDTGTWLTVNSVGNNVFFNFDKNNTGSTRSTKVTITNLDTLQTIEIFVVQYATVVTADNIEITADNNLITADNG